MEKYKKPYYKYCVVPMCPNNINTAPDKVYFLMPKGENLRKKWCKAMRRDNVSCLSCLYCCEDHFNIISAPLTRQISRFTFTMGPDQFLNQLEEFDFKAPIDVQFFDIEDENLEVNIEINHQLDDDVICVSDTQTHYKENHEQNNKSRNNITVAVENINNNKEKESNFEKNIDESNQTLESHKSTTEKDKEYREIAKRLSPVPLIQNIKHINITGDPLDVVSKSLIYIMESYCLYLNTKRYKQSTSFIIEQSRKNYLRIKYHYFKFCRDNVISKILPRNHDFVHKFINRTISLARIKKTKNKNIFYKYINTIYYEMINWIKINKIPINSQLKSDNPLLLQQLTRPSVELCHRNPTVVQPTSINDSDPKSSPASCIFTSGPPGREISINVAEGLLNNFNTDFTANEHSPINIETIINNRSQQATNSFNSNSELPKRISNDYENEIYENINKVFNESSTPPSNSNFVTYQNNSFSSPYTNPTPNYSTVSVSNQNLPNNVNQNCNIQQVAKKAWHSSMYNDRTHVHTDNAFENNRAIRNIQTAPPFETHFQNQIRLQNNSNGFQHYAMPISSTTISNNMNRNTSNSNSDTGANILRLEKGTDNIYFNGGCCQVCKMKTKIMCSGCFKVYYCTKECQVSDWNSHKSICHQESTIFN